MSSKLSINLWYLITIFDPEAIPGKNIVNLIKLILKEINFKFIIFDDINGAKILPLVENENEIMELDESLKLIKDVIQFEWGDFFLFKNYPLNWVNLEGSEYPRLIAQTDTTIRAIDNSYIYIYTQIDELVELVKKNYTIESITQDFLENLEFPY